MPSAQQHPGRPRAHRAGGFSACGRHLSRHLLTTRDLRPRMPARAVVPRCLRAQQEGRAGADWRAPGVRRGRRAGHGRRGGTAGRARCEFVSTARTGKSHTIAHLFAEGFSAGFVGVGSLIPATMKAPGEDLPGVYQSTDFLIRTNVPEEFLPPDMHEKPRIGRRVAVVGGGDTASDCLRTALRLGAEEVTCVYRRTEAEMPGGKKERALARAEGARYRFLTQPARR